MSIAKRHESTVTPGDTEHDAVDETARLTLIALSCEGVLEAEKVLDAHTVHVRSSVGVDCAE